MTDASLAPYDVTDYSTWQTEDLLNHMVWLSDDELESGDDNSQAIIQINDILEARRDIK